MAFAYNSLLKLHQKKSCENYANTHKEEEEEENLKVQDILGDVSSIKLRSTDVFTIANVKGNGLKDQNLKTELANNLESESCIKIEKSEVNFQNIESNENLDSKYDVDERSYILGI